MYRLTPRHILIFWSPLAATWMMMGLEGPVIAATIARLPDPKINLAAFGVAFAIAILIEAPVMMLMSTATALVRDRDSYRRLRLFATGLNATGTLLLCVLLTPPAFDLMAQSLLRLPPEVARLTYGALWIYLPWPAAIGFRRLIQGVLIREGKTRQVAAGTAVRLIAMVGSALALSAWSGLPGAWIGSAALTTGVVVEAFFARWMATATIRSLLATGPADSRPTLSYAGILTFYYPLALTSFIGLSIHPMLTFFMGNARAPLESLAVYPVVNALVFLFRAVGISYQEAAIALASKDENSRRAVARFGAGVAGAASLGLALVGFTPLFEGWFEGLSGLTPELSAYARIPVMVLVLLPALSVWLSCQRALLVLARHTKAISAGTAIEVGMIAVIFAVVGWGLDVVGVTAAAVAALGGRLAANLYLHKPSCRS